MPPSSGIDRNKHSGFGEVLKSLTKPFKPTTGRVPVVVNAKVVGGGTNMPRLLHLLRNDPLPIRAQAAREISQLIDKVSISSTTEIWYLARDLCSQDQQSAFRRSGLRVLIECIKKQSDTTGDKLIFYRDIVIFCNLLNDKIDPEFDLFLEALVQLTENGKDLHDLNIYNQDQAWGDFVVRSFELTSKFATTFGRLDSPNTKEYLNLINLLRYLKNCFEYNSVLLEDDFISKVLQIVIFICQETENSLLIEGLTSLIHNIAHFSHIPTNLQLKIVKLLCWLSYRSSDLQKGIWETLVKMSNDAASETILCVVTILQDPTLQEAKSYTLKEDDLKTLPKSLQQSIVTALGSIGALEHLLLSMSNDPKMKSVLPFHKIYCDITDPQVIGIPILNTGVLRLFARLMSESNLDTASSPFKSFPIIFPFHLWCLTSASLFDLLLRLNLSSAQDQDYWAVTCMSLLAKYEKSEIFTTRDRLVSFFLQKSKHITEEIANFILKFFEETNACVSFSPNWKENCDMLLQAIHLPENGTSLSTETRIKSLQILYEAFEYSLAYFDDHSIGRDYLLDIIRNANTESDPELVDYLYNTLLFNMITRSSMPFLKEIMNVLEVRLVKPDKTRIKSIISLSSFPSNPPDRVRSIRSERESEANTVVVKQNYNCEIAKVLCKSMMTMSVDKPEETKEIYEQIIAFCHASLADEHYDVILILARVLIRIRCSEEGYIYFCQPTDMEGLATTMNRNTLIPEYKQLPSHQWSYPEELPYLPQEFYNQPIRNLTVFSSSSSKLLVPEKGCATIDISLWFSLVAKITEDYYHWELYSYVWAHFCSQLCNMRLFDESNSFIIAFRKIICDQLSLNLPLALRFPLTDANVTKADLLVAFIRTLSSLIGYHYLFNKQEEDHIVSSLLSSMASWEKTAIPSIHMMTICCYEIPESMKKYLIPILTRLQTSITSAFASSHTLEFLMSLTQAPTLTSNFTIEEFKRMFAIAFRYIEHAMDMKKRKTLSKNPNEEDGARLQHHGVDAEVDHRVSTQWTEVTPVLHQYLLTTSYEVMAHWFLKIKLEDRSQVSSFIMKSILSCSGAKQFLDLDDVTISHLDFVARFTYSNLPLRIFNIKKESYQPNVSSNKWIVGQSIVGINVNMENGDSTITLRRPTDVTVFDLKLNDNIIDKTSIGTNVHPIFTSNYLLLQLFRIMDQDSLSKVIPLNDDSATGRAISTFDRVPVVSHHKAGIVYIGPGQKEETEILANTVGSPDYQSFLEGIGRLIKLSESSSIYVGGLDTENGTDGQFAYFWNDELSQVIFHTTTLMPTTNTDKYLLLKKRHIGNNHVNVFFDESGQPFNFNVIRSQFNFVNIVISPHTVSCNAASRNGSKFYKVKTFRRSEVPGIFSTSHYKLISLEKLSQFIRNSVLMANRFARIWHESIDGTYVTNWEQRVIQLRSLRQKALATHQALFEEQQKHNDEQGALKAHGGSTDAASANMIQSFLEQLQAPTTTATLPNHLLQTARYEAPMTTDDELYNLLEFNSFTY